MVSSPASVAVIAGRVALTGSYVIGRATSSVAVPSLEDRHNGDDAQPTDDHQHRQSDEGTQDARGALTGTSYPPTPRTPIIAAPPSGSLQQLRRGYAERLGDLPQRA